MDGPKLTRGFSFNIMDKDQIEKKQEVNIDEVIETLGVSDSVARSLLIKFLWDKEKLIQKFYDGNDLVLELFNYDRNCT